MFKKFAKLTAVLAALGMAGGAMAGDAAGTPKHVPQHDISWIETPFGPLASPVAGDFSSGGHVTLIRFSAGMKTPLHTHSHAYTGIVLSGTTRHYTPGRPETETLLPAGSHWYIPGNLEHVSECLPGAECIMALYQDAAMDFVPAQ